MTKKQVKNQGEVPQYYVPGSHDPIISPAVFDFVQTVITNIGKNGHSYSHHRLFSGKIRCGACNGWYGSKTWHAGTKYEKRIWRCNHKYNHHAPCATPTLSEDDIKTAYLKAFQQIAAGGTNTNQAILDEAVRAELDTANLEAEADKLFAEVETASANIDKLIDRNARTALNQDEYARQFQALTARNGDLAEQHEAIAAQIFDKQNRLKAYEYYKQEISEIGQQPLEFSPYLWHTLLDHAVANEDSALIFVFRDGRKIDVLSNQISLYGQREPRPNL